MSINNTSVLNTTKRDKTDNEQQHNYNYNNIDDNESNNQSIKYMIYLKI